MGVKILDDDFYKQLEEIQKVKTLYQTLSYIAQIQSDDNKSKYIYDGIESIPSTPIEDQMIFNDDDRNLLSKIYGYNKYLNEVRMKNNLLIEKDQVLKDFDSNLQRLYKLFYQKEENFILKENGRYIPNLDYDSEKSVFMNYNFLHQSSIVEITIIYQGKQYRYIFNHKHLDLYTLWSRGRIQSGGYKSVEIINLIRILDEAFSKLYKLSDLIIPTSLYDWIMKCEEGDNNGIC